MIREKLRASFYLIISILLIGCTGTESNGEMQNRASKIKAGEQTAIFAGGCFWCMDAPFEKLDGVVNVVSGYAGGHVKNPSYEQVESGTTGHVESVEVIYNPKIISYAELLTVYWKQFDPTDAGGSFYDRGPQYKSVIFYKNDEQKKLAEKSKAQLDESGLFNNPIVTEIKKFTSFYPAEDYHQHFYKKNPERYHSYRKASGRDKFILGVWGDSGVSKYKKPSDVKLRKELTALQYNVTQKGATEPAFENKYWNNNRAGIYVDIVSGEPLFSSTDKFKSGTGWPSFTKPIDPRYIVKKQNSSGQMLRVEVRSAFGDSHLGDLFDDGPAPTNLRYCINSAALKFIPEEEMKKEGYGEYLYLFDNASNEMRK